MSAMHCDRYGGLHASALGTQSSSRGSGMRGFERAGIPLAGGTCSTGSALDSRGGRSRRRFSSCYVTLSGDSSLDFRPWLTSMTLDSCRGHNHKERFLILPTSLALVYDLLGGWFKRTDAVLMEVTTRLWHSLHTRLSRVLLSVGCRARP